MKSKILRSRPLRLLLFLSVILLLGYWSLGLFPGPINEKAQIKLKEWIGREIYFERVFYMPGYGIQIDDVTIPASKNLPSMRAGSIRLQLDEWRFLKENELHFNKIHVKDLSSRIDTLKTEHHSSSDQISSKTKNTSFIKHPLSLLQKTINLFDLPTNVYLHELRLQNSKVALDTTINQTPISTELHIIDFTTNVSSAPKLPISMKVNSVLSRTPLSIKGELDIDTGFHSLWLEGLLLDIPSKYHKLLPLKLPGPRWLKTDYKIHLQHKVKNELFIHWFSKNSRIQVSHEQIHANLYASLDFALKYQIREKILSSNQGTATIHSLSVTDPSRLPNELNFESGEIVWDATHWTLKGLTGKLQNSEIDLNGTISRDKLWESSLSISQKAKNLSMWEQQFPEYFNHPIMLNSLDGDIQTTILIKGPLLQLSDNVEHVNVTISNASLKPKFLQAPLTSAEGTFDIRDHKINISDLSFLHKDQPYKISGQLARDPSHNSQIKIFCDQYNIESEFKLLKNRIELTSFDWTSFQSKASFEGTIDTKSSWESHLSGSGILNIDDLDKWRPSFSSFINKWQPKGRLAFQANLHGPLSKPSKMKGLFKTHSNKLSVMERVHMTNAIIDFWYENSSITMTYAKATLHDGEIRSRGIIRIDENNSLFDLNLFMNDVNLEPLGSNFESIKKLSDRFRGTLSLDLQIHGDWNNKPSILGKGNFNIQNGQLWTTHLFHELRDLTFVTIEGMENVSFNAANGSFNIANQRIFTDDTTLTSHLIDIHASGSMSFEQELDFHIQSRFNHSLVNESIELGGIAQTIMNIAENRITQYRVTGTADNPITKAID